MSTTIPRPSLALRALLLAGICLLLPACASDPATQAAIGGRCNDSALGWAIGTTFDEAAYQRLLRESGAGLVNPIGPGSNVRGDSRTDRLRVYVDRDNRITAARCE